MTGWRRLAAGLVLAAVVLASLAGCSNDKDERGGNTRDLRPGTVAVKTGTDAHASIDGVVSVKVPGDSISGSGTLSVRQSNERAALDSPLVEAGGPVVAIEMEGAALSGPATVSFTTTAPPRLPGGIDPTPVMVSWDPKAKQWVEEPSLYDAATHQVASRADHFSLWSYLWPSERLIKPLADVVSTLSGTKASQPACGNEEAARSDGWTVTSDSGDRIMWCFGLEGGRRVVRVGNNRPYPVVLAYDGTAYTLAKGPDHGINVYSLYRALLEAQGKGTSVPQVALPAGATLALEVRDGAVDGTFGIETQWDGFAMSAELLDLLWQTILLVAGGSDAPNTAEKFVEVVTQSDCIRDGILGDNGLNQAKTVSDSVDATFQFLRTCGADLAKITADAAGRTNPIYGIVSWLTVTLPSALRQLVGDAYGIHDIWTTNTGAANYRIALSHAPASESPQASFGLDADPAEVVDAFISAYLSDDQAVLSGLAHPDALAGFTPGRVQDIAWMHEGCEATVVDDLDGYDCQVWLYEDFPDHTATIGRYIVRVGIGDQSLYISDAYLV